MRLFSQSEDQLEKPVDDGLVQKINKQRLSAAPAEEAGNRRFSERAGQQRLFFAVGGFPDGSADEKVAQLREKRKIVARHKALVNQTQRKQPMLRNDDAPDGKAGDGDDYAKTGKRGRRQLF